MVNFNYDHEQIIKEFLKKIAKNSLETYAILTHKEVRFLAYQIRASWHNKQLEYGAEQTNKEISFWIDRLCEYGIPHKQRSRIANHLLFLLKEVKTQEPQQESSKYSDLDF